MKRIPLLAFASALALAAPGADPYAGYIYPAGIQAGTTNRFIVGGQGLGGLRSVHFDNPGLKVLKVEVVPNFPIPANGIQRRHLVKWLDGIAAGNTEEPPLPDDPHINEWRSNEWWRVLGTLDKGKIAIVERNLFVPRNALQATPSLRQMSLVTVAADKDARPGWSSFMIVGAGGISAPRPFAVTAARHVEEPLYAPPHRRQPEPPLVDVREKGAILDGQIRPGSTDVFRLHLAAKKPCVISATARELQPYIGDAVPGFFNVVLVLKNARGAVVMKTDDSLRFRPDPVMYFTPQAEGVYSLEIHDVLYRGRADFVYSVAVNAPEPRIRYPSAGFPRRVFDRNPDGVVSAPGEVSRRTFVVDEPGPRVLDLVARRRGSPLDAVLSIRKASGGPVLAQWDDVTNKVFVGSVPQGECDPIGVYDFKEAGEYVAEVTDRTGHGGKGYNWWLDVRRKSPAFYVYSARSTLPLNWKSPVKVDFVIDRRNGFDGDVSLEFPDGVQDVEKRVFTAGVDRVTAKLVYKGLEKADMRRVSITACAKVGNEVLRVPVVPCDEYEQAFAWKHLLPAKSFTLNAPPLPPNIAKKLQQQRQLQQQKLLQQRKKQQKQQKKDHQQKKEQRKEQKKEMKS